MLFDLFTQLTTRCSPSIRHIGYLAETIAMRQRYRQRQSSWKSHLGNTRRFVLAAAERCGKRDKAVIIGSGLLLDVPLAELSSLFKQVVLMDVICLPEIRKLIKNFGNVTFIEHEATSVAEQLYSNRKTKFHQFPEVKTCSAANYGNPDLVVSLNILSQLWVIPRAFAIKILSGLSQDKLDDWCSRIVESHYASLRSLPCNVCLVGDYEVVKRDIEGKPYSRGTTIYNLSLPKPDDTWTWDIGPLGEESLYYSRELNVGAWHLK